MILTLLFACPVAAETWTTPEAGVRVPLPEGWVETGSGSGRRSLTRADDPHEDFRDSIILLFRPRTARADPQQLLEMLTADAARQQAVEVKRSELIERAGHRVAWFDAMLNKGPNRILAQQFLLPRDDGIVVVFGFSAPARAAEVRGLLEAMLDGLDLTEGADRRLDGAPTVAVLGALRAAGYREPDASGASVVLADCSICSRNKAAST